MLRFIGGREHKKRRSLNRVFVNKSNDKVGLSFHPTHCTCVSVHALELAYLELGDLACMGHYKKFGVVS